MNVRSIDCHSEFTRKKSSDIQSRKIDTVERPRVILVRTIALDKDDVTTRSTNSERKCDKVQFECNDRPHRLLAPYSDDEQNSPDWPKSLDKLSSSTSPLASSPESELNASRPMVIVNEAERPILTRHVERPFHLRTSIADRLSGQPDFSGSGTEDEDNDSFCSTPSNKKNAVEPDQRQTRLVEILKTEKKHLKTLKEISVTLRLINSRPKTQTQHTKKAQELVENLLQLQKDYVTRLDERAKAPFDMKTSIARVFEPVTARQEELLKYQVLSQSLVEYFQSLHTKGLLCFSENGLSASSKKTANKLKCTEETMCVIRHNLQEPIPWISQTLENIKLMMTLTPSMNPDTKELKKLFNALTDVLHPCTSVCLLGEDRLEKSTRELKVHSMIVELENMQSDERKIRYLLLFTDVLVCAKIRMMRRDPNRSFFGERATKQRTSDRLSMLINRSNQPISNPDLSHYKTLSVDDQQVRLETKWMIPLNQLVLGPNTRTVDDQQKIAEQLERLNEIKEKIRKIRREMKGWEDRRGGSIRPARSIPHLTKIEGQLALHTPQLILPVSDAQGHTHYILLVTEREREQWRVAIETQKSHLQMLVSSMDAQCEGPKTGTLPGGTSATITGTLNRTSPDTNPQRLEPKIVEMNELLKKYSQRDLQMVRLNKTGIALLKRSHGITGILHVTVHKLEGFNQVDSYHIRIEIDSYGQYEEVARTRVVTQQANPEWNQSFDIHVDDAHQVCFTVYRHCDFVGYFELLLEGKQLSYTNEVGHIETNETDAQPIYLTFSTAFKQKSCLKPDNIAPQQQGIFKKPLKSVIEMDRQMRTTRKLAPVNEALDNSLAVRASEHYIPRIVTACVDEIERRGLREVGLYRICGADSDIQTLASLFDQDQEEAIRRLPTFDISVITSLLKLFFRELPEPLLTNEGSRALMQAGAIQDENQQIKALISCLKSLPSLNAEIFYYLGTHLITVARYKTTNKMHLGNLSLIWSAVLFQSNSDYFRKQASCATLPASGNYVDFLNLEASVGFHQTKTLAALLTAVQDGKLTWPRRPMDVAIN